MVRDVKWLYVILPLLMLVSGVAWAEGGGAPIQPPAGTHGPQAMEADPGEAAGAQAEPAREPTPEEVAREPRLKERAEGRWGALIAGDYTKAYAFETPEYRKQKTAEDFGRQFGRMVSWHLARVKDVMYHRPGEAEVVINLDYSFPHPDGDGMLRTTGRLVEQWVFLEDEWWHVAVPQTLPSAMQSKPSPQE